MRTELRQPSECMPTLVGVKTRRILGSSLESIALPHTLKRLCQLDCGSSFWPKGTRESSQSKEVIQEPVDRLLWMLKALWSTVRKFLHSMRLTNRPL